MKQSESLYFKYTSKKGTYHWAKYTFTGDESIFERDWDTPPYIRVSRAYRRVVHDRVSAREVMSSMGWEPCSYEEFIKQRMLFKHD